MSVTMAPPRVRDRKFSAPAREQITIKHEDEIAANVQRMIKLVEDGAWGQGNWHGEKGSHCALGLIEVVLGAPRVTRSWV